MYEKKHLKFLCINKKLTCFKRQTFDQKYHFFNLIKINVDSKIFLSCMHNFIEKFFIKSKFKNLIHFFQ